ncbi:MAG: PepSY domain-containing protein [Beijerinckiaceae bacterium]
MVLRNASAAFLSLALFTGAAAPALADRRPNPDELARIEQTLRAAGYISWEEIEFDDGVWEVDDARKVANGQDCDVDISPDTYQIVAIDC